MSGGKTTSSDSWEQRDGYKPEWAQEIDVTSDAAQHSDSEIFDQAVEMGVEAARGLERDEKLGLIPPRQRPRRRIAALIVALVLAGVGVGIAIATHYSDSSSTSQQEEAAPENHDESDEQKEVSDDEKEGESAQVDKEKPPIQPEKQPDGSYHTQFVFLDDRQKILVPAEVLTSTEPWVMRIHGSDYGENSFYTFVKLEIINDRGWNIVNPYIDYQLLDSQPRSTTCDYTIPLILNAEVERYYPLSKNSIVDFHGSGQLDVDFLPVSVGATQWNTSEPLKGSFSDVIAFSGSLENLRFHFGKCKKCEIYAYDPSDRVWVVINKSDYDKEKRTNVNIPKPENIKKLGFDKPDSSGYLFVYVWKEPSHDEQTWWYLERSR
ncbi:MAG: hypothetical protein IKS49_00300 [Actinomycetaceae bacterium]|nr:hypothetical protein [Actinomycetaceae bacterium]